MTTFNFKPECFLKSISICDLELKLQQYINKSVIYLFYIGIYEGKYLIKFGRSTDLPQRTKAHHITYIHETTKELPILSYILETPNVIQIEHFIKNHVQEKQLLLNKIFENSNKIELFYLTQEYNLNYMINFIQNINKIAIEYPCILNTHKPNTLISNKTILDNQLDYLPNQASILTINNVNKDELLLKETRLKLYLDCLKTTRFNNSQDLHTIGLIIFNEGCDISLFLEYSKKSDNYNKENCLKEWSTFSDCNIQKKTITTLIELARIDTYDDKLQFLNAVINDKISILSMIYDNNTGVYITYLFYILEKNNYVYDAVNDKIYYINKYGIYVEDIKNSQLTLSFDSSVVRELDNEYIRRKIAVETSILEQDPVKKKELILNIQLKDFNTYKNLVKYCNNLKNKNELIKSIKPYLSVPNIHNILNNNNPYLVGFLNGVYDLENITFRNARRDEYVSVTTGYDYKKADSNLKQQAFNILLSIFSNKLELEYVLKYMSLGLYGKNSEEKFYIWNGSNSNYKNILNNILEQVLGDYYDTLDVAQLYKSSIAKKDAANSSLSKKRHCRFIISTEPHTNMLIDTVIIKKISGNTIIETRPLYGETIKYTPKFKLTIYTNLEPKFSNIDNELLQRTILINFSNKGVFKEDLKLQLEQNMYRNEFLEILIDYFNIYRKDKKEKGCGLILPERFLKDTNNFIKNNDPVNDWIKEEVVITNNSTDLVGSNTLFNSYKLYHQGDARGVSQYDFKELLAKLGIKSVRKSTGVYYKGITIEGEEEDD